MIDIDKTNVTLQWKPSPSDGNSPLTGYIIEKKEVSSNRWIRVETVKPNVLTCVVPNLNEGSDYHFRVMAENKIGVSEPLTTSASIKAKSKFGKLDLFKIIFYLVTKKIKENNPYLTNY